MKLKFKKLCDGARLPARATAGSAGLDLRSCEDASVLPGEIAVVKTGLAVELPAGSAGLVFGRSGLGIKHGVSPANAVGVIDSDYRGEIKVGLINHGKERFEVQTGDRIAQLVIVPVLAPEIEEAASLEETERGAGGFGSTGRS